MAKARVLLVDEDPASVEEQRAALEAAGKYEVVAANNVDEGLSAAAQGGVDAAVVDLPANRPDAGLEVVGQLRRQLSQVPVMVLTPPSTTAPYVRLLERAGELGAKRCVRKPVSPGQLANLVGRLISPPFYELEPMAYEM